MNYLNTIIVILSAIKTISDALAKHNK